jgi:hypothetical protein
MLSQHSKVVALFIEFSFNHNQQLLPFGRADLTVSASLQPIRSRSLSEAKRLQQIVSHGSTEYSVIFMANQMKILVAVDDLKTDMWDAPYLSWREYQFEELFTR